MTYGSEVWLEAEKHFLAVAMAKQSGNDVKVNLMGDLYLSSKLWGDEQKRYTGIHAFNMLGSVKPLTGINLTEPEWDTLVENFHVIKDLLQRKNVSFGSRKRSHDADETIKVFVARWVSNGKCLDDEQFVKEYFSKEEAVRNAQERRPLPGKDYPENEEIPQIRVECLTKPPPEDTDLMRLILIQNMDEKIGSEIKRNCEACQVNSDSQFDHTRSGNCLDTETDHLDVYYESARKNVKVNELMVVFDGVRKRIGARPVFSKQLAKAALAWISRNEILSELNETYTPYSPLMRVIKDVQQNEIAQ